MPIVMRKFEWDAGHRLINHEGQCKYLHGHRYVAEVSVLGELDELGRVIDFGCMKEMVGQWIKDNWDHNMLLHKQDPIIVEACSQTQYAPNHYLQVICGRAPYQMDGNPTAENIARELFFKARQILKIRNLTVLKVRVWETPNCCATFGQKDFNRATNKSAANRKGTEAPTRTSPSPRRD